MDCFILHTVNAGLYLWDGHTGLLVDGLHRGTATGFSVMPEKLRIDMDARTGIFSHLDVLLFTHTHRDHFDAGALQAAQARMPEVHVYCSDPAFCCGAYRAAEGKIVCPGLGRIRVAAISTAHIGPLGKGRPHESFLITAGENTILIAGDGRLDEPLARCLRQHMPRRLSALFVGMYQLHMPECQAFIRAVVPEQVLLYHLPFPEDDVYHYWLQAKQVLQDLPEDLPQVEAPGHMAWLNGNVPEWWQ